VLAGDAGHDDSWETRKYALGGSDGESVINVADNPQSSSLLDMLPAHLASAPESAYVGQEKITVKTLDGIFAETCAGTENIFSGSRSSRSRGSDHGNLLNQA